MNDRATQISSALFTPFGAVSLLTYWPIFSLPSKYFFLFLERYSDKSDRKLIQIVLLIEITDIVSTPFYQQLLFYIRVYFG